MSVPPWLKAELVPLAWCWKIARRDGVILGFTSHDRSFIRDGLQYRATPGIAPSALSLSDTLESDTMDIRGALTSDAITEADLTAGRWDGAQVWLYAVNWEEEGAPMLLVAQGELGAVDIKGGGFAAELTSVTALLDAPVAPETSPDCRATFGDADCRVDVAARTRLVELASATGRTVTVATALAQDGYGYGRLRFVSGPNSGLSFLIEAQEGDRVRLAGDIAFPVEPGTRAEVTEGCDKRFATCCARFGNAVNFRGEPHLPGMDYITRYPGAG